MLVLTRKDFHRPAVANLNRIIRAYPDLKIVLNSAWNIEPLADMRNFLVAAGFDYPMSLIGRTASSSGGGLLARQWLVDNNHIGTPYILIDDSTREMGPSWGRLAQCRSKEGLTDKVADNALFILGRGIGTVEVEVACAIHNIMADNLRLITSTPWLTGEQRLGYIKANFAQSDNFLADPNFLRSACLGG